MTARSLAELTGRELRMMCRKGEFTGPTTGCAHGFVQANLVILPQSHATDFEEFCQKNPRPCPLLEITPLGVFEPSRTAAGGDLRTDLPRYRIYQAGKLMARPTDILGIWPSKISGSVTPDRVLSREVSSRGTDGSVADWVAFLIGCSFTFEAAMLAEGLPVRHIEECKNVPMFRTHIPCKPAGRFHGPLVVSMRPMTAKQAEQAAKLTEHFPDSHGAPIHIGDPGVIGITHLARPDYGDAVTILPGEVPVFWACGVTPMEAIMRAAPPLAITHEPGHMFVTDLKTT